jgi:hypothetical protein
MYFSFLYKVTFPYLVSNVFTVQSNMNFTDTMFRSPTEIYANMVLSEPFVRAR